MSWFRLFCVYFISGVRTLGAEQKQKQVRQWARALCESVLSVIIAQACVLREMKLSDVSDEVCWL